MSNMIRISVIIQLIFIVSGIADLMVGKLF
jgi:hypothetical protein